MVESTAAPRRDVSSAYLFAVLLAVVSAHHFYLREPGIAWSQITLWWGGWLIFTGTGSDLLPTTGGLLFMLAAFVWWLTDLCLMPRYVREANARAVSPIE